MVATFLYGEVAALRRGQSENGKEVRSDSSGWNCQRRRAVVQPHDRGTARARANILKDIAPKIAEVLHRAIARLSDADRAPFSSSASKILTSRSAPGKGSGRSSVPSTTEKMAVFAPIPSASVAMAMKLNPGDFSSMRNA